MEILPDELKASILSFLDGKELLVSLSNFKNTFYSAQRKYGKMLSAKFIGSAITDANLGHLRYVHDIDLTDCQYITDRGLRNLTGAKRVILSLCRGISNSGMLYVSQANYVSLKGCNWVTEKGARYLAKVKELNLGYCKNIDDAALVRLANVQTLDIAGCEKITNHGLHHLFNVKNLNISRNNSISDAGLSNLMSIESLHLCHCKNITNGALEWVKHATVHICGCTKITGIRFPSRLVKSCDVCEVDNADLDIIAMEPNFWTFSGILRYST